MINVGCHPAVNNLSLFWRKKLPSVWRTPEFSLRGTVPSMRYEDVSTVIGDLSPTKVLLAL